MLIYTVQKGDTLYGIFRRYGIAPEKLRCDNRIPGDLSIVPGQTLVLITPPVYIIRPGDTLSRIADIFGMTPEELLAVNPQITTSDMIRTGEKIYISKPKSPKKAGINGYAYPDTGCEELRAALPHLSYLSIFSYHALKDGSLSPINDLWLIQCALTFEASPRMVITNIDVEGNFSGELAHSIFSDETAQDTLMQNVLDIMRKKGYDGLDVDFEYIFPGDREGYNRFLRKAAGLMHASGYSLTSAVAPKHSSNQQGILYEGHDYEAHGQICDQVIIMTYEWGYTYSSPMAVAPADKVRAVLDYAVSVIPREKILMGIPNYGYDWTLPYKEGTAAKSIGNHEAVLLAMSKNAEIHRDEAAKSPYFYYTEAGVRHVVWFEDAKSIYDKLLLVDEYGLSGVSYWTIGRLFPQNWTVLGEMYGIQYSQPQL